MADGVPMIPQVVVGGDSLVSANYANKIIVPLNAILQGRIAPINNVGSFKYAGGQFILDLSLLDQRLRRLEAGGSSGNNSGGNANVAYPFQISQLDTTNINVRFGTVSDLNVGNVATNLIFNTTGNFALYINAVIDNNGVVTNANIQWQANTKPADTYNYAYKLVGYVGVGSNVISNIFQSLWFSQAFKTCDRNTADPATTPGSFNWYVD